MNAFNHPSPNNKLQKTLLLNDGNKIPIVGLGTYKMENDALTAKTVQAALEIGYRHIDTAAIYGNEVGVGQGIRQSTLPREKIFLTTKVWNDSQGYDPTLRAFEASLKRLQCAYIDLYLIHWPLPEKTLDTWAAICKLKKDGLIRSIGVCNFKEHHLKPILEMEIIPSVNQVELHPQFPQEELHIFCQKHKIILQGWAPLIRGKVNAMRPLQILAEKYKKTPAQIALRWQIQQGIVTIPKTTHPERLRANINLFTFSLSAEDFAQIKLLAGKRIWDDPDHIDF